MRPEWSVHCISEDAKIIGDVPSLGLKLGKKVENIYYKNEQSFVFGNRAKFSSVPEWLAKIRNTNGLVFTDSYHCVCMCILFRKSLLSF